jgi:uncharacterized damage-inducible protein DinB
MAVEFTTSYIKDAADRLSYYKRLAERALEQVPDQALFATPGGKSNSIAILVKHLSGNMRSRWTDFLSTDGEKPDRDYKAEFVEPPNTREQLMQIWEAGWRSAIDTLSSLSDEDLGRTVTIRSEPHSVVQAINRQMTHISYHVGQIVYLAKHFGGQNWKSLTAPHNNHSSPRA